MDRMTARFRARIVFSLVLASLTLLAGCPDGLIGDIMKPDAPAAPTVTAGDTSLSLSWTAVEHADTYNVYWHTLDDPTAIPAANKSSGTITTSTIGSLTNDTVYYVWVSAENDSGESALSPSASGTPAAASGIPAAPGTLTVSAADSQLSVSWTAVSDATSYDVSWNTVNDSSATPTGTSNTTTNSTTITGLTNGTPYFVWVKAKNTSGSSAFSPVGTGTPVAATAVPSAPGTLTITPGSTTLTVSWTAVSGATSYDVSWNTVDNSSATPTGTSNTTNNSTTVTGLTNGTTYYVWVKAKNTFGSSGFSPVGSAVPNGSFTVQLSVVSTQLSYTAVGDNTSVNNAVGEKIIHPQPYVPTHFSVFVHKTQYFKKVSTGVGVAVDLHLSVWKQTDGTLLASSTAHIEARSTTGSEDGDEVIFTISGAPVIPANTPVLYAVYLPDAIANDIKGNLLYYASSTEQFGNGRYWYANNADDTNVASFTKWTESTATTYDLKFKLTGVEQ